MGLGSRAGDRSARIACTDHLGDRPGPHGRRRRLPGRCRGLLGDHARGLPGLGETSPRAGRDRRGVWQAPPRGQPAGWRDASTTDRDVHPGAASARAQARGPAPHDPANRCGRYVVPGRARELAHGAGNAAGGSGRGPRRVQLAGRHLRCLPYRFRGPRPHRVLRRRGGVHPPVRLRIPALTRSLEQRDADDPTEL